MLRSPLPGEEGSQKAFTDCARLNAHGTLYPGTSRNHLGIVYDVILRLWILYSKISNRAHKRRRREEILRIFPTETAV